MKSKKQRTNWTPKFVASIEAEAKASGKSLIEILKSKGLNPPSFYKNRKKMQNESTPAPKKRRTKHATIELAPPPPSSGDQLVCLMGSADQIRAFLASR